MSAETVTLHTLRNGSQYWLGEIAFTSTGMLAGVTEYGNFAYAWRSFGGCFETFLASIGPDYFEGRIEGQFLRMNLAKREARRLANLITTEVFVKFQEHLRAERAKGGETRKEDGAIEDRFASCHRREPCTPSGCAAGRGTWPRCPSVEEMEAHKEGRHA